MTMVNEKLSKESDSEENEIENSSDPKEESERSTSSINEKLDEESEVE